MGMCDVCSANMTSESSCWTYQHQKVCTSPGYWLSVVRGQKALADKADGSGDPELAYSNNVQLRQLIQGDFTVCEECHAMLSGRDHQLREIGLGKLESVGIGAVEQVMVVAGVVWQQSMGEWPSRIDDRITILRDKVLAASEGSTLVAEDATTRACVVATEQREIVPQSKTATPKTQHVSKEHRMMEDDTRGKARGLIRYVLLVVSHPEWEPTTAQMSDFVMEKLPEFAKQPDGTAKVGLLWETKPMSSIDMAALAVETFGNEVSDESTYTYRTVHFGLKGGEAKIFVIYEIAKNSPRKWWQIWK